MTTDASDRGTVDVNYSSNWWKDGRGAVVCSVETEKEKKRIWGVSKSMWVSKDM